MRIAGLLRRIGFLAASAQAHWLNFTGGETQDWYVPAFEQRYIVVGSRPQYHSYSFVSANDIGNPDYDANFVCAKLAAIDQGQSYERCGIDFVRYCYYEWRHGPDYPDCHDRDGHSWWAGARNNDTPGTTIKIHGTY